MQPKPSSINTPDPWDDAQLAADAQYAMATPAEHDAQLDAALNLRMISIRLPDALIEDFKNIATIRHGGVGYQTLMRLALKRFASTELQTIARDMADQMQQSKAQATAKTTTTTGSQNFVRKSALAQ
jgi:uncharacterized protein (DUF4415 family)